MSGIPPEEIAGRYTIERELGRGATAVVYLAHDRVANYPVALKVLRRELSESLSAERFLREIRLTQLLSHPNIVAVLDSGVAGDLFYCALTCMDGGTLRDRLNCDRQLPLDEVAAIATAMGAALQHAHSHHLIHRDVKPENILFGDGRACLADFGIARALEALGDITTSTGVVRGTPAYMSPEQASGEREYDGRSDVYSLACSLYEAIGGVAAFVGPSAQAVLSQRLVHLPRSVRVYRPMLAPEVDAVLMRALAIAPADRYQNASAFTDALVAALALPASGGVTLPSGSPGPRQRHRAKWSAVLVVVALAAAAVGPMRRFTPWAALPFPDTTRVALLSTRPGDAGLLWDGFKRWRGVTLVDKLAIDDALHGRSGPISPRDWRKIAIGLGAGRYLLSQVDSQGGGRTLYGALYDVRGGQLYQVWLPLGPAAAAVYAAMADSLLLRGATDVGPAIAGFRNLPSIEFMLAGGAAVNEWDLAAADSLFSRAAEVDTASGRPLVWLAQIRSWATESAPTWLPAAQAALAKPATLAPEERALATGLVALGTEAYLAACTAYQTIVDADPRSFAGWYGLGECHAQDDIVIRDRASPSGWRFRSSYEAGVRAYATAFTLRPRVYRGFQAQGFSRLRQLLYVSSQLARRGVTHPGGPLEFLGSPILNADTIVFVPMPPGKFAGGDAPITAGQIAAAVGHQRERLQAITAAWAQATPRSPYAKEAVAIALELRGDPAATDSLAAAQRIAIEPMQRLRLAVMRAYVMVKFGAPAGVPAAIPFDPAPLVAARTLADSLLRRVDQPSADEAALLSVVAALTGRCGLTAKYLRLAAPIAANSDAIPQYVLADAHAMAAYAIMGCTMPAALPSLDLLASRIASPGTRSEEVLSLEDGLIAPIVLSRFPADSAWLARLAPTGDYLAAAGEALLAGHPGLARSRLSVMIQRRRDAAPGDVTPDAVLTEARLWLAMGDSAAARRALASSLGAVRNLPMLDVDGIRNVILMASLVRAMALQAGLDAANPDRAKPWRQAVSALWSGAEPDLQSLVRAIPAPGRH